MDAEFFDSLWVIYFSIHDVEILVTGSEGDFRTPVHGTFHSDIFHLIFSPILIIWCFLKWFFDWQYFQIVRKDEWFRKRSNFWWIVDKYGEQKRATERPMGYSFGSI